MLAAGREVGGATEVQRRCKPLPKDIVMPTPFSASHLIFFPGRLQRRLVRKPRLQSQIEVLGTNPCRRKPVQTASSLQPMIHEFSHVKFHFSNRPLPRSVLVGHLRIMELVSPLLHGRPQGAQYPKGKSCSTRRYLTE